MNWKSLIGSVAPVLGGALGGPFGAMAGKWLATELGVDESTLADVSANPETLVQIRALEQKFKVDMAELGLDEKKLHADDRSSARNLAINTSLLPQAVISCIFILGFVSILYTVFTGSVVLEGSTKDVANFLLGILSAGIIQIMNFFFGSSAGSKEKTLQLGGSNGNT